MNHQPFEALIFDAQALPAAERRALSEHIENCAACRQLQQQWLSAQRELRARALIAPAPGFTERWRIALAQRKADQARRQAWRAFLLFGGATMFLLLGLIGYVLANSTPADWLAFIVRCSVQSVNLFDWAVSSLRFWVDATPLALNIAIGIYAAVTLCLLSVAWVFALWRTSVVGVFNR